MMYADCMKYRIENKYIVSESELKALEKRLSPIMQADIHQDGDCYEIRSLYFDDLDNRCMDENEAGVDVRKKYRIRIYGPNAEKAKLEIKEKLNNKTRKSICEITRSEVTQLMQGEFPLLLGSRAPLNLLQINMKCLHMEPKIVITYERTAFVYPEGNVRITFDRNITASRVKEDLYAQNQAVAIPVLPTGMHILEVKYDEFLPQFIARQIDTGNLLQTSFSKYYLGRLASQGIFPV